MPEIKCDLGHITHVSTPQWIDLLTLEQMRRAVELMEEKITAAEAQPKRVIWRVCCGGYAAPITRKTATRRRQITSSEFTKNRLWTKRLTTSRSHTGQKRSVEACPASRLSVSPSSNTRPNGFHHSTPHRLRTGKRYPMKRELIKISEFQRRRWDENGTPPCPQAIHNYIRDGKLPGEQIGKLWYIDWAAFNKAAGNDLVAMVLKGAA